MEAEILTDTEAAEIGLPVRCLLVDEKDGIEWSGPRLEPVTLQCSTCGNTIVRNVSIPADVSLGQPKFTCKECTSASGRRRQATNRRGRPHKASLESGHPEPLSPLNGQAKPKSEVKESVLIGALSAGLAGFLPVLNAGLAPAALPA